MKTNVSIELTDGERDLLATLVDKKDTARKITRVEVVALCQQHISGLVHATPPGDVPEKIEVVARQSHNVLYDIDPKDPLTPLMARPDDPGYVYGWNKVKRGAA